MNERMAELFGQAGISDSISEEFGIEYLAELLIKECADIAYQFSMENKRIHPDIDPKNMPEANQSVYHCTCQAVGHEIREHFGVK